MVLVSLAKLDKYYVVDGKMLGLDKKKMDSRSSWTT
jgi:hypothetical protein